MLNPSAAHFEQLDKTALPLRAGHHCDLDVAFDHDGRPEVTVLPDMAAIVDERNGWSDELPAELRHNQRFAEAAELLGAICTWLAQSQTLESAGRRAVALAWAVRPASFGDIHTMTALAQKFSTHKAGIQKMSRQIFELSNRLFTSRTMQSPSARETARRRATEVHRRLGHHLHRRTNNE